MHSNIHSTLCEFDLQPVVTLIDISLEAGLDYSELIQAAKRSLPNHLWSSRMIVGWRGTSEAFAEQELPAVLNEYGALTIGDYERIMAAFDTIKLATLTRRRFALLIDSDKIKTTGREQPCLGGRLFELSHGDRLIINDCAYRITHTEPPYLIAKKV